VSEQVSGVLLLLQIFIITNFYFGVLSLQIFLFTLIQFISRNIASYLSKICPFMLAWRPICERSGDVQVVNVANKLPTIV
jgi:hypothetical protein